MPRPVAVVTGPTGVGKTAVALALAEQIPLRVISADSMQVYRRMDIGTAKPTREERERVIHYGLDLADPVASFSVAAYLDAVLPAVAETQAAGELALIVGGARLYIEALTGSFSQGSPPLPALRESLEREADLVGVEALHARLAALDPVSAARIAPQDRKRIMRALEVYQATGRTISSVQEESRQHSPRLEAVQIALVRDRDELYQMVEDRVDRMMQEGWLEEVEGLLRDGCREGLEAIKAHGYRELAAYLESRVSLQESTQAIKKNVRNYVRYQLGWIRQKPQIQVIHAGPPLSAIVSQIRSIVEPLT